MVRAEAAASAAVASPHCPDAMKDIPETLAPAHWRCVDFISDLHLCAAMPKTFAAWTSYMQGTSAQAVFILGDLFEVWVGDDACGLPFEARCIEVLRQSAATRHVSLMVGNRDFLLGESMQAQAGTQALADPVCLALGNERLLLTHGDSLCISDTDYQAFRKVVRSQAWQAQLLRQSLDERLAIAAKLRSNADSRKRYDGAQFADVDAAAAVSWLTLSRASAMIHGHTHRPASDALAPKFMRHVLSDWDLDSGSQPRAQVLRWTRSGLVRITPQQACE